MRVTFFENSNYVFLDPHILNQSIVPSHTQTGTKGGDERYAASVESTTRKLKYVYP